MYIFPEVVRVNKILPQDFYRSAPSNIIYYNSIKGECGGVYKSTYSVKYVTAGEVYYRCGNRQFRIGAGNFLVVNHGTDLAYETRYADKANEAFSVCIDKDIVNEVFASIAGGGNLLDEGDTRPSFLFYEDLSFRSINDTGNVRLKSIMASVRDGRLEVTEEIFYQISELLVRSHLGVKDSLASINKVKTETRKEIFKRVHTAVDYIADSITSRFDLNQVARVSLMSKFYLIKHFREVVGMTPNEFHIRKRIEKAVSLLRAGVSVSEASQLCGYADVFTFSKQFKKITGCPPSRLPADAAVSACV